MAKMASKHEKELDIKLNNFYQGLNEEVPSQFLTEVELSECSNLKYINNYSKTDAGGTTTETVLSKRQGTVKINASALPSSVSVRAATYYIAHDIYILATDTKLYYLDSSMVPVEIGSSVLSGIPTFTEFKGKLFIHDGGTLKCIDGATPTSVETISDRYEDEITGIGDGATKAYDYTLLHSIIKDGTINITYYNSAGTAYNIIDDNLGILIGAGTGTINYATGALSFTCTYTPANNSVIICSYSRLNGAPKSTSGLVRGSRLYLFGDPDNTSRGWYSGVQDEYAWDDTVDGGYFDADPADGQTLQGAINFYQTMFLVKSNSIKRLDNFPGDAVFRIEPLVDGLGAGTYYKTIMISEGVISFLSSKGWSAVSASTQYGDVQAGIELSRKFHTNVITYLNSNNISEYFPTDRQLWLGMYSSSTPLSYIYTLSVPDTQLSTYKFDFNWSCFKFVNGEMLIGSTTGNLYRMTAATASYEDDGIDYHPDTYASTGDIPMGIPYNRKLMKQYRLDVAGDLVEGNLEFFKDGSTEPCLTRNFPSALSPRTEDFSYTTLKVKFNEIKGPSAIKLKGITMRTAVLTP